MEKYNKEIAPNPLVEMIHLSMDQEAKEATEWAVKESFPWLTVLPGADPEGLMSFNTKASVPEYILVDAAGKVILVAPGEQVFAKIKELSKTKTKTPQ